MKVKILKGVLLFGVGAAMGCTMQMQPAVAGCYGTQPCATDTCADTGETCKGSPRSNGQKVTTGGVHTQSPNSQGVIPVCGLIYTRHPNPLTLVSTCSYVRLPVLVVG